MTLSLTYLGSFDLIVSYIAVYCSILQYIDFLDLCSYFFTNNVLDDTQIGVYEKSRL